MLQSRGMTEKDGLVDLRVLDVRTFLSVQRCGSVTGAARELKVSPSQVSKAVARLEEQLRVRLLARSSRGVQLTDAGRRLAPKLEDIVQRLSQLGTADQHGAGQRELTVAAPSYLINSLLPRIALALPKIRLRGLELPPALIRAYARENFFDLTLTVTAEPLPPTWTSVRIGQLRKALFARPALAATLGAPPIDPKRLRGIPFVSPIYSNNGQFVPVQDDCPWSRNERVLGHEAQTIGLALELVARLDQVAFGPVWAAQGHLLRGTIVELPVAGWDVKDPLFLVANGDRVLAQEQRAIVGALEASLAELDPPARGQKRPKG